MALALVVGACAGSSSPTPPSATRRDLARASQWADSLADRARRATDVHQVGAMDAVAAGYLERLRVGLGSPFRLAEYASRDPRLSDSTRARLTMAILARTLRGEAYQVDPAALASIGARGRWWRGADGAVHLALIERTIDRARDPRGGELAVRVAYALARAEGEVGRQALPIAAQVAALVRDRALARRDAAALLSEAERGTGDVGAMLGAWRATGRFAVERPPLDPVPADAQTEAMREAPRLLAALREVGDVPGASADAESRAPRPVPVLGPAAARRLGTLASVRRAPPQAAVTVTLRAYRDRLLDRSRLAPVDLASRARLISRAYNEETLVAEYAEFVADSAAAAAVIPKLAMLSTAVAMRPLAQESVWFPSFDGPSVTQLRDRWGIAAVSFDRAVPPEWRPYYLRLLATGIADLQRVLPALELRGVGFHFGERVMNDSALAMHDPVSRTIFLPVMTGGGTLAHEVVHDLDWQVARSRYGLRGAYSTDWAVREQHGRMAASLRGLTAATLIPPLPENHYRPPHGRRPAEVFARNADWFVAVALAREGRMNGYLTAVQDELLTGYAGVTPPDVAGDAADAVADLLDDMTFVAPPTRTWFLSQYGRARALGPYDIVRRALTLPAELSPSAAGREPAAWNPLPWTALRAGAPRTAAGFRLGLACTARDAERAALERALFEQSVESRARGLLRSAAYAARFDADAPPALRALNGAPWAPALAADTVARATAALLGAIDAVDAAERPFASNRGCGVR